MEIIKIVNLKCSGCAKSIEEALTKAGLLEVRVDLNTNEVSFDGSREKAKKILERLGYPEVGSQQAKSLFRKAQSFLSCAKGKIKK